jgi:hypothetical protein
MTDNTINKFANTQTCKSSFEKCKKKTKRIACCEHLKRDERALDRKKE